MLVVSIVYTTWTVMNSTAKLSLVDMFSLFFPPAFAVLLLLLQFWVCRGALIEGFANAPSQYDNGKVYRVGDVVTKDGIIYIMNDGIGAAGYPPPRPTNWTPVSADSNAALYTSAPVVQPLSPELYVSQSHCISLGGSWANRTCKF